MRKIWGEHSNIGHVLRLASTIDGVDAVLERDALAVDRRQLAVQVRDCDSSASGQRSVIVVISYS